MRRSGASLLEMVITVALFAVVLSVIGSLLTSAARVSRRADSLSWANQASGWLDMIEFDVASARTLSVAPGASENRLEVSLRDIVSANFLPASPPDPWNPDASATLETHEYKIQSDDLVLTITSSGAGAKTSVLGPADAIEVERLAEGDIKVIIRNGKSQVGREVPPLLLESERAPF